MSEQPTQPTPLISLLLPLRIISEANLQQNWREKYKRQQGINMILRLSLNPHLAKTKITLPCAVCFTRIAPRPLDEDNLLFALKNQRDEVTQLLTGKTRGRGDEGDLIKFSYAQQKSKEGKYALKLEIFAI